MGIIRARGPAKVILKQCKYMHYIVILLQRKCISFLWSSFRLIKAAFMMVSASKIKYSPVNKTPEIFQKFFGSHFNALMWLNVVIPLASCNEISNCYT